MSISGRVLPLHAYSNVVGVRTSMPGIPTLLCFSAVLCSCVSVQHAGTAASEAASALAATEQTRLHYRKITMTLMSGRRSWSYAIILTFEMKGFINVFHTIFDFCYIPNAMLAMQSTAEHLSIFLGGKLLYWHLQRKNWSGVSLCADAEKMAHGQFSRGVSLCEGADANTKGNCPHCDRSM